MMNGPMDCVFQFSTVRVGHPRLFYSLACVMALNTLWIKVLLEDGQNRKEYIQKRL